MDTAGTFTSVASGYPPNAILVEGTGIDSSGMIDDPNSRTTITTGVNNGVIVGYGSFNALAARTDRKPLGPGSIQNLSLTDFMRPRPPLRLRSLAVFAKPERHRRSGHLEVAPPQA